MYNDIVCEKNDVTNIFTKQQHTISLINPFLNKIEALQNDKKFINNKKDKKFLNIKYGNTSLKIIPVSFNSVQRNYTDQIDIEKNLYNNKFSFRVYRPLDCLLKINKLEQLLHLNTRYTDSKGLFGLFKKSFSNFSVISAISDAMEKFRNLSEDNQKYSTFVCEISINNLITYNIYVSIIEGDFE